MAQQIGMKARDILEVSLHKAHPKQDCGLRFELRHGRFVVKRVAGMFRQPHLNIRPGDKVIHLNGVPAREYSSVDDLMKSMDEEIIMTLVTERSDPMSSSESSISSIDSDYYYQGYRHPGARPGRSRKRIQQQQNKKNRVANNNERGGDLITATVIKSFPNQDAGLKVKEQGGRYYVDTVSGLLQQIHQVNIRAGDKIMQLNGIPTNRFRSVQDIEQFLKEQQTIKVLVDRAALPYDTAAVSEVKSVASQESPTSPGSTFGSNNSMNADNYDDYYDGSPPGPKLPSDDDEFADDGEADGGSQQSQQELNDEDISDPVVSDDQSEDDVNDPSEQPSDNGSREESIPEETDGFDGNNVPEDDSNREDRIDEDTDKDDRKNDERRNLPIQKTSTGNRLFSPEEGSVHVTITKTHPRQDVGLGIIAKGKRRYFVNRASGLLSDVGIKSGDEIMELHGTPASQYSSIEAMQEVLKSQNVISIVTARSPKSRFSQETDEEETDASHYQSEEEASDNMMSKDDRETNMNEKHVKTPSESNAPASSDEESDAIELSDQDPQEEAQEEELEDDERLEAAVETDVDKKSVRTKPKPVYNRNDTSLLAVTKGERNSDTGLKVRKHEGRFFLKDVPELLQGHQGAISEGDEILELNDVLAHQYETVADVMDVLYGDQAFSMVIGRKVSINSSNARKGGWNPASQKARHEREDQSEEAEGPEEGFEEEIAEEPHEGSEQKTKKNVKKKSKAAPSDDSSKEESEYSVGYIKPGFRMRITGSSTKFNNERVLILRDDTPGRWLVQLLDYPGNRTISTAKRRLIPCDLGESDDDQTEDEVQSDVHAKDNDVHDDDDDADLECDDNEEADDGEGEEDEEEEGEQDEEVEEEEEEGAEEEEEGEEGAEKDKEAEEEEEAAGPDNVQTRDIPLRFSEPDTELKSVSKDQKSKAEEIKDVRTKPTYKTKNQIPSDVPEQTDNISATHPRDIPKNQDTKATAPTRKTQQTPFNEGPLPQEPNRPPKQLIPRDVPQQTNNVSASNPRDMPKNQDTKVTDPTSKTQQTPFTEGPLPQEPNRPPKQLMPRDVPEQTSDVFVADARNMPKNEHSKVTDLAPKTQPTPIAEGQLHHESNRPPYQMPQTYQIHQAQTNAPSHDPHEIVWTPPVAVKQSSLTSRDRPSQDANFPFEVPPQDPANPQQADPFHKPGDVIRATMTKGDEAQDVGLRIEMRHGRFYVKKVKGLFRQFNLPVFEGDLILHLNGVPAKRYSSVEEMMQSLVKEKKISVVVQHSFDFVPSDSSTSGYVDADANHVGYDFQEVYPGEIMRVEGLTQMPEWNGSLVRVWDEDDKPGRWLVQLVNDPKGQSVSVAQERLVPIDPNEQTHHPLSESPSTLPSKRQQQDTRTGKSPSQRQQQSQPLRSSTASPRGQYPGQTSIPARPTPQRQQARQTPRSTRPRSQRQPPSLTSLSSRPPSQRQPPSQASRSTTPPSQRRPPSQSSRPSRPPSRRQPPDQPPMSSRPPSNMQPLSQTSRLTRPPSQSQQPGQTSVPARPPSQKQQASQPSMTARLPPQSQPPSQRARSTTPPSTRQQPSQPSRSTPPPSARQQPSQPSRSTPPPSARQQPSQPSGSTPPPSTRQQPIQPSRSTPPPSTRQQPSQPSRSTPPPSTRQQPSQPSRSAPPPSARQQPSQPLRSTPPPSTRQQPGQPLRSTRPPSARQQPSQPSRSTSPPSARQQPSQPSRSTPPPSARQQPSSASRLISRPESQTQLNDKTVNQSEAAELTPQQIIQTPGQYTAPSSTGPNDQGKKQPPSGTEEGNTTTGPTKVADGRIRHGEIMVLKNLKAKAEWNGQSVKVLGKDTKNKDRWYVRLVTSQEIISVAAKSLQRIEEEWEEG